MHSSKAPLNHIKYRVTIELQHLAVNPDFTPAEVRVKRQDEDLDPDSINVEELCKDRPGDEYFRLSTDGDCREVVRCDDAGENGITRLAKVRCPTGLYFDVQRQTCDWKTNVKSCDLLGSKSPGHGHTPIDPARCGGRVGVCACKKKKINKQTSSSSLAPHLKGVGVRARLFFFLCLSNCVLSFFFIFLSI
uniref:Chitin-binding type-2 domain-containing protein n=1 Tax=Anopheles melas TaxID=34690 RepID=A0A182UHD7_9DIPT